MTRKVQRKHRRPRIRRRTRPGAEPGTIQVAKDAAPPTMHLMAYGPDACVEESIHDVKQLDQYLGDHTVCWITVTGLGNATLIRALGRRFGLHVLSLEDVVNVHQRAKLEPYDDHLFLTSRVVQLVPELESEQISCFVGAKYVLTFLERPCAHLAPIRERIRRNAGRIRAAGPDYLMYAILDTVVDAYFPVVDAVAEQLDELERNVVNQEMATAMSGIHQARNDLLLLRRDLRPHRDLVNELIRDEHPLIADNTRLFLRDVYDHSMQLIDLLTLYREMCGDLRDYSLAVTGNRMNEIMKVLTIIATIFIPMSFITGLYGMNFDTSQPWNMPELHWRFGYPFALGLMALIAAGLMSYFWRRGWLMDRESALVEAVSTNREEADRPKR